ncbi:hypothetical protein LNKW23_35610 [Paralimibaculum aggregatum]|uniref:Uncharacterized protein n=1 Tax=Paralimibaculum aggregatum TaxID=3036245 RepID=A0ABQ6LMB4_9RHOB|nr:hypothetical protein [Limibaculum sp. NKW23]GMG84346.1 hypothetical protein LNKW23_35610 [Limibaculum sp. NKW23]
MRFAFTVALALLAALPAPAQHSRIPAEIAGEGWDSLAHRLAAVEQAVPLVRSTREIGVTWGGAPHMAESDLRVTLLVLDLGPATDVSERQSLHLAMFNVIAEFGTAWSLTPVADVWAFHGARRLEAGIYEIDAEVLDFSTEACVFHRAAIRVDARELSAVVRRARGLGEFDSRRFRHPVAIETRLLGCIR